jgi:hypothetical protein
MGKQYLVVADDGPELASSDTYDGAVTACLWMEQQEAPVGTPLTGGRFRIVESVKTDKDGVQICRKCDWPKAWDEAWPSGYCQDCLCSVCQSPYDIEHYCKCE